MGEQGDTHTPPGTGCSCPWGSARLPLFLHTQHNASKYTVPRSPKMRCTVTLHGPTTRQTSAFLYSLPPHQAHKQHVQLLPPSEHRASAASQLTHSSSSFSCIAPLQRNQGSFCPHHCPLVTTQDAASPAHLQCCRAPGAANSSDPPGSAPSLPALTVPTQAPQLMSQCNATAQRHMLPNTQVCSTLGR